MSLLSLEDLTAQPGEDPGQSYAALSVERMRDSNAPMPPAGSRPSASEVDAFAAWIDAGMPGGSCADATSDFDTDTVCSTNSYWTDGDRESPNMHPGRACITCHEEGVREEGEVERGPRLSLAGTVYATGHEPDDCNGRSGLAGDVTIEVTDARGSVFRMRPNRAGNFYREDRDVSYPITARVLFEGRVREMRTEQMSGDCNGCHTERGDEGAPGRIMLP
jgi:hypothetical protein